MSIVATTLADDDKQLTCSPFSVSESSKQEFVDVNTPETCYVDAIGRKSINIGSERIAWSLEKCRECYLMVFDIN